MKRWMWTIAMGLAACQLALAQAQKDNQADKPAAKKDTPAAVPVTSKDIGWLGVRLNLVPTPLVKHLGLEGGLMVGNVVVGSPADKAGLQRYDIIVAVDGQPIQAEPESLVQLIRHKKAGDPVRMEVIHRGQKKQVQAMLDKAPASLESLALKYADDDPDMQWTDKLNVRSHVLAVGPDGKITILDPKEMLPEIQGLIRGLPGAGADCDVSVSVNGDKTITKIVRSQDGKKIEIQQDKDGKTTVTRTAPGTAPVVKTYKSAQELAKGDAEASELLKGASLRVIVDKPGLPGLGPMGQDFDKKMKELQEKAAKEAKQAQQQAEKIGREARETIEAQTRKIQHAARTWGQPDREFKLNADGTVEVTIRKGGDQVSLTFKNEQEFKQKEPKLYEEFRTLKQ